MNPKRETLRKTAAFISALTFLSATSGLGMTGVSAAGTYGASPAAAGRVSAYNSSTPPVTTKVPDSGTSTTTTPAVTTTSATTTTTTTTTTAKVTANIDLSPESGSDIPWDVKNEIYNNIIAKLQEKGFYENSNNGQSLTISYDPDKEEEVTGVLKDNEYNIFRNNGTLYHAAYNEIKKQIDCTVYYQLTNDNKSVESFKFTDTINVNGSVYVKKGTVIGVSSFTLKAGYKFDPESNQTYVVDGAVNISDSEIKIGDNKKFSIDKCSVTVIINCRDAKARKVLQNWNWNNFQDKLSIDTNWVDLQNERIEISADNQESTKNLVINGKIYDGAHYTAALWDLLDESQITYKDDVTVEIEIIAAPKKVKVARSFDGVAEDENYELNLNQRNNISIPYVTVYKGNTYYLSCYKTETNKEGVKFDYDTIVKKMNNNQPVCDLYYYSDFTVQSDDKVPVELFYKRITAEDEENNIAEAIAGLIGGTAVGDVIYVKPKPSYTWTKCDYINKTFTFIDNLNATSTFSTNADTGKGLIRVNNTEIKLLKVLLMNNIVDDSYEPCTMTPFIIYLDSYEPKTKIAESMAEWSNENEFRFDFTVSDIENLQTSSPYLTEDVNKINNAKDLSSVASISVAGYEFKKPDGGWDVSSSYTMEGTASADAESKYNVTLKKNVNDDGEIYFTADVSLKDPEAKGVNEKIEIFATDAAGNVESPKTVTVKIDLGDPKAEAITVNKEVKDGYLQKGNNLTVKADFNDEYPGYAYSDVEKIIYSFCDQEVVREGNNLNSDAVFEVKDANCSGYIAVEIFDYAGNTATYYYRYDGDTNVTDDLSFASTITVDNTKPQPADITAGKPEYTDNDKVWYSDYPDIFIKDVDDGEVRSGISVLKFKINDRDIVIGEDEITGTGGYTSVRSFAADLENEGSCYIEFEQDKTDKTSFVPYLKSKNDTDVKICLADKPISLKDSGELTVALVSVDRAGNESDSKDFRFFVDNTVPDVKGTFERGVREGSNDIDESINMYQYGTFADHRINIRVPVSDGSGVPSSGYKKAVLSFVKSSGETVSFDSTDIKDGYAVFNIPEELVGNSVFAGTMEMKIIDNVGNTSDEIALKSDKTGSGFVVLETIAPFVSEKPVLTGDNRYEKDVDGETQIWFSSDVSLKYDISDAESGIASVEIVRERENGESRETVSSDNYTGLEIITSDAPHTISTETGVDGRSDFHVNVSDSAGNSTTRDFTVYKDTETPYVYSISFNDIVKNNDSDLLTESDPEKYSHFHNADHIAIVTVKDDLGASAGIDLICCELYNSDGTLFRTYTFDDTAFYPTGENDTYAAEFVIPEGFKGDIRAWTTDKVNHRSAVVSPNGFISEGEGTHDNAAYEHISIALPPTERRDTAGRLLYNQNVNAAISVSDMHSGISSVRWRTSDDQNWSEIQIDADGNITGDSAGWSVERSDRNIVQSITRNISVTRDANDDFIQIVMTDNSSNSSQTESRFSIDKQKPVITVSGIESSNEIKYYNTHKTVHVAIAERNFDDPVVNNAVDSRFADDSSTDSNSDQFRHTRDLVFSTDGRYSVNISNTDLAGNAADEYTSGTFVVDTIAPTASVTVKKTDGSVVANGDNTYIDDAVQAVVNVTEENFDPKSVNITINGKAYNPGEWSGTSSHSITIPKSSFSKDGTYTISVSGKDLAGNAMKSVNVSFTIDQKSPDIEMSGVMAANKGDVAPVVEMTDQNYKSGSVKLYRNDTELKMTTENDGKTVKYAVDENGNYITASWEVTNDKNGTIRKLVFDNFTAEEIFDGSYKIAAETSDMAENSSSDSLEFSVNRFGSVFTVKDAEKINNRYLNESPSLTITERNVDKHSSDSDIVIIVDKGSNTVKLTNGEYTVSEAVQLEDKSGYEYTYTIHPEVFDQDLDYSVSIQSVDAAGNKNVSTGRGAEINFSLDTHDPEFKCDGLADKAEFRQSEREFRINVNEKIKHITVKTSDGKVLLDEESENGESSYTFVVPASNSSRDLTVELTDLAGNKTVRKYKNLLITENIALYMLHKTWVKAVGASVIALLGALGGFIFVRRRKKNK